MTATSGDDPMPSPAVAQMFADAFPAEIEPRRPPVSRTFSFPPTDEQHAALGLFAAGRSMAIVARAGTGKTSTLRLIAESTDAPGVYLAFNKAIVGEAKLKMPRNVAASTAHSLAFRTTGRLYAHRLDANRMASWELAHRLDVSAIAVKYGTHVKRLGEAFLASTALKAIGLFCQTADPEPTREHVPYIEGIDEPDALGRRTYDNNNLVAAELEPVLARAWADLRSETGGLPFTPDHYFKMWQLDDPKIPGEFILVDEAQDLSPVMIAAVAAQDRRQVVWVGDDCQQIYGWRGAVNALGSVDADDRRFLTRSFRFGPAIAAEANNVLRVVGPDALLIGDPSIDSRLANLSTAGCFLTRTNAAAVSIVMAEQAAGRIPHLVGGGKDVISFARAARDLQAGGRASHRDLAMFSSWGEVQAYVGEDPQGDELKLLVKLVDEFGVEAILYALERMPPEESADVVVSTAHKSKGREWPTVILWSDFPQTTAPEELRLAYVAATRAKLVLDPTRCGVLNDLRPDPGQGGRLRLEDV